MKNMMFLLALTFGAMSAQAGETTALKSTIERILSGQSLELIGRPNTGVITVDSANFSIHIDFISDPCNTMKPASGINCMAAPQKVSEFDFRLDSVRAGSCDTLLYSGTGQWNGQPVEVEVSDNRDFYKNCKSVAPVPATRGTMTILLPDGARSTYNLIATELK